MPSFITILTFSFGIIAAARAQNPARLCSYRIEDTAMDIKICEGTTKDACQAAETYVTDPSYKCRTGAPTDEESVSKDFDVRCQADEDANATVTALMNAGFNCA
jgi:hypothetical protein